MVHGAAVGGNISNHTSPRMSQKGISQYLGELTLTEGCVTLLLIQSPDALFELKGNKERKKEKLVLTPAFTVLHQHRSKVVTK